MEIETSRLILKVPTMDDFKEIYSLFSDPLVMRYIQSGKALTKEETLKAMEKNTKHWETFGHGFYSIFEKKTRSFIGRGGLIHVAYNHADPNVEVGYILSQDFWNKGYATEIATHLIHWGFAHLEVPYLMAMTWKENRASQNVLKKVGFTFDHEDIYPNTNFKSLFFKLPRERL